MQEGGAVGDGGDGCDRAGVLEVILQVIVGAGEVPPRRAWLLVGGPLEGFLRPILPGPFWAFTFQRDKSQGFKVRRQTLFLFLILFWMVFLGNPRSETKVGRGNRIILRSKPS